MHQAHLGRAGLQVFVQGRHVQGRRLGSVHARAGACAHIRQEAVQEALERLIQARALRPVIQNGCRSQSLSKALARLEAVQEASDRSLGLSKEELGNHRVGATTLLRASPLGGGRSPSKVSRQLDSVLQKHTGGWGPPGQTRWP